MRHLWLVYAVASFVHLGGFYFAVTHELWASAIMLPCTAFLCWVMACWEVRHGD